MVVYGGEECFPLAEGVETRPLVDLSCCDMLPMGQVSAVMVKPCLGAMEWEVKSVVH